MSDTKCGITQLAKIGLAIIMVAGSSYLTVDCKAQSDKPAGAADADGSKTPNNEPLETLPERQKSGQPLRGVVQFNAMRVESQLRHIQDASKKLQKTTMLFAGELTRANMVTTGAPNVIGNTVIPAMPSPAGQIALGHLPARKKMLMAILYELSKVVMEIHQTQQLLEEPLSERMDLIDDWYAVTSIKRDIVNHYNQLKLLTDAPQIDEKALSREIIPIYDDTKKIQEPLRRLIAGIDWQKSKN